MPLGLGYPSFLVGRMTTSTVVAAFSRANPLLVRVMHISNATSSRTNSYSVGGSVVTHIPAGYQLTGKQ